MNLQSLCLDSKIYDILESVMCGKELSINDAEKLFHAKGNDINLIGMAADHLRYDAVGDLVTYVVNRNINFTNVCIKQCGFCAFSRDFRNESGQAYMLPSSEIVRRAQEAYDLGATEVCVQAGLPPDMSSTTYEDICRAIKSKIPDIHIHGFSPEEVLYGSACAGVSLKEYLLRLKDAGVDTLPGTSAEILDQKIRDKISPGRITVQEWEDVIQTAHNLGINTTSTMMYGHVETSLDRVKHIAKIREIQKKTGGFTEFVPLSFISSEAPMYKHNLVDGIKSGPDTNEILLTHAISRLMLYNFIDNIQVSWVKEGLAMSQLLLVWGVNDFGGTLINESISTSAGASHGQLLRPVDIRRLVGDISRVPAQRDTVYKKIIPFEDEPESETLNTVDTQKFGSFFKLIKSKEYSFTNPRIMSK